MASFLSDKLRDQRIKGRLGLAAEANDRRRRRDDQALLERRQRLWTNPQLLAPDCLAGVDRLQPAGADQLPDLGLADPQISANFRNSQVTIHDGAPLRSRSLAAVFPFSWPKNQVQKRSEKGPKKVRKQPKIQREKCAKNMRGFSLNDLYRVGYNYRLMAKHDRKSSVERVPRTTIQIPVPWLRLARKQANKRQKPTIWHILSLLAEVAEEDGDERPPLPWEEAHATDA
jgi:hypothetical protein